MKYCMLEKMAEYGKWSLPAWECGLKWEGLHQKVAALIVTPCVGVWIEIKYFATLAYLESVTPCVGVWIEIVSRIFNIYKIKSLPAWECGLK